MNENYDLIIIGAGASGMMAAVRGAMLGVKVLLLEKGPRLGTKLRLTGKGRCNLTNTAELDDFIAQFGKTGPFLYNSFLNFFNKELIEFFEAQGLKVKEERGGRIFPLSDSAHDVLNVFKKYLFENKVRIFFCAEVEKILANKNGVFGVSLKDKRVIKSKKVILATGGLSYSKTGSSGEGFKIAHDLGHTVIDPQPALVPLEVNETWIKKLQGLSLKNIEAGFYAGGKKIASSFGEMLFTHFGVSGPIILSMSTEAVDFLNKNNKETVTLHINFKPALTKEQLKNRLIRDIALKGRKNYENFLKGLLPAKLIPVLAGLSKIKNDKKVNQITSEERETIISLLTNFKLTITKPRPIEEAIITKGGISTKEINAKTMESKFIKGLYFCGEIIDIEAKTGGYNLQAAFSTGYLAGQSASEDRYE